MLRRIISAIMTMVFFIVLSQPAFANNSKLIALTFDDGPSWKYTPELLDGLAERGVKVTFFLVGYTLEVNMDIAERAFSEGHQLANHSYSHSWFSKQTASGIASEIDSTNALLEQICGEDNFLVRIPYGDVTSTVKSTVESPIMQWSVDPTNGNANTSQDAMYRNLMNSVHDGAIVLLHDTSRKNLNVAFQAIDALLEQGYEFVTLNELFRLRGVVPVNGEVYTRVSAGDDETYFDEEQLEEHWAWESVNRMIDRGIMTGTGSGFMPEEYISRAMGATVLHRLAISVGEASESSRSRKSSAFEDVSADAWYYNAVCWASENSYLKGVSGGFFDPHGYMTKEQFYTMIARFASDELESVSLIFETATFRDDVRISSYAKDSVALLRSAGYISQNDLEIFRPGDNITRAEAAELVSFITELFDYQHESSSRLPEGGGYFFLTLVLAGFAVVALYRFRDRLILEHSIAF